MAKAAPDTPRPMTAAEVRKIVGRIDDAAIASIIATGAGPADVLEAYDWLHADDDSGGDLGRPRHGVVARVFGILAVELAPPEVADDDRS